MKKEIATDNAPKAIGPYSQGILWNDLIFASGQIPVNPANGEIPASIKEQTKQVLENVSAILKSSGSSIENVIKTTVFIKNMNDFAEMNAVYETYFIKPFPARSTVEVARLPKDVLVEIEVIAYK